MNLSRSLIDGNYFETPHVILNSEWDNVLEPPVN